MYILRPLDVDLDVGCTLLRAYPGLSGLARNLGTAVTPQLINSLILLGKSG